MAIMEATTFRLNLAFMKLNVYLFALLISLFSCQSQKVPAGQATSTQSREELKINYLALGDSYTIGEGVKVSERYPNQLARYLSKKDIMVDEPKIIAKTGWRCDELISAFKKAELKQKYELVSILIGVNNQYQNKAIKEFKADLETLIKLALNQSKYGEQGVVLISIPDYGVTPFAKEKQPKKISAEIDQYNQICKEMASTFKLDFYYITDISRKASADPTLLAEDELHPSAKMYQLWVEDFGPKIENRIRNLGTN